MIEDLDLGGLVMAWGRGWTVSRGLARPVDVPGGWRADVGLPGHRVRYVLHSWDAERLAGLDPLPGTWVKVVGEGTDLRAALPAHWTVEADDHLMTAVLSGGRRPVPDGYRIEVTTAGDLVTARVLDAAGEVAAAAYLGRAGEVGVIDRVETSPDHRRRGLGTVVMTALSERAAQTGVTTGVLVATPEGRALYESLGWTVRTTIAAAHIPEP